MGNGSPGRAWASGEVRQLTARDGAPVAVRRTGRPGAPCVLLGHGNGFSIDAFGHLARQLDADHQVFRMDLRNHGRSARDSSFGHEPADHVADVAGVLASIDECVGGAPVHGVFHSISGVFAMEAALARPGAFASLTLMEPPLALPTSEPLAERQNARQQDLAASTVHRRARFASPAAFAARLEGRAPFDGLDEAALQAYARGVLRRGADGEWHLACPPALEAALYASNLDRGVFERLPTLGLPGTVISGTQDPLRAATARRIAERAGFDHAELEGLSHLMPMEAPRRVAGVAARQVARVHRAGPL